MAFFVTHLLVTSYLIIMVIHQAKAAEHYRLNAMDLCAWHARRMEGDVASNEATQLWKSIVCGDVVCPFCGQKHDSNWISRNAWNSQVNAMVEDN